MPLCRMGKIRYYGHENSLWDLNVENLIVIMRAILKFGIIGLKFHSKKD